MQGEQADGTLRVERMSRLVIPEYDDATHSYAIDGRCAPGVTDILKSCGIINTTRYTEEARELGKVVHLACRYEAEGDLDIESIALALRPYLEAYRLFCVEMSWKPDLIEQPLGSRSPLYCGMPDQVQKDRALVDLKTGDHEDWHEIQSAAYLNLLPYPAYRYERWEVHLRDTGKYSMRVFPKQEYAGDLAVFFGGLNVHNWKARKNGGRTSNN